MDMKSNTILITGGGSGIGRGLAEAFHKLGNQVIISGRRQNMLDAVTSANPGMKALPLDIEDSKGIQTFAAKIIADFPRLNAVVHNAGIARMEKLKEQPDVREVESMVTTNVLGPIRLNAALLPPFAEATKGNCHDRLIRPGLRTARRHACLFRNEGIHPLVHRIPPPPAPGDESASDRIAPSLRADRTGWLGPGV